MPTLHDQMSRHGSRRGQGRDGFGVPAVNADGWSQPVQTRPEKAGNLSGFGKLRNETSSISLGPSGHFAKGSKQAKEEKQKPGASNPFAALESHDDAPEQPERQKLQLAPRTKPVEGEQEDKPEQEEEDDGAIPHDASSMSTKEAERRADNSVKEVSRCAAPFAIHVLTSPLPVLLRQGHQRRCCFDRGPARRVQAHPHQGNRRRRGRQARGGRVAHAHALL